MATSPFTATPITSNSRRRLGPPSMSLNMAVLFLLLCVSVSFRIVHAGSIVPLGKSDIRSAVDCHNQVRIEAEAAAMQQLNWNAELAKFAERSASRCKFEHSSHESRQNVAGFSCVGENIYTVAGDMPQPTIKDAVKNWADEKKDYDLHSNQCSTACKHYTQIVWSSTTDVGCAIGDCPSIGGFSGDHGFLIFCNYGIGGNMAGEHPYEAAGGKGKAGSKCKTQFKNTADSNGLCVGSMKDQKKNKPKGKKG